MHCIVDAILPDRSRELVSRQGECIATPQEERVTSKVHHSLAKLQVPTRHQVILSVDFREGRVAVVEQHDEQQLAVAGHKVCGPRAVHLLAAPAVAQHIADLIPNVHASVKHRRRARRRPAQG